MNAKHAEWFKNRQWWHDISAMRADSPFWWHGRSIQEMRAMSKKAAVERQTRLDAEIKKHESLIEETKKLTQMRFGKPGADKPRLAACRAKLRLIESKRQPAPGATKSEKPRLRLFQARIRALENSIARRDEQDRAR